MTVMDRLFSFPYLIRTSGKVNLTAKQARLGDDHYLTEIMMFLMNMAMGKLKEFSEYIPPIIEICLKDFTWH